MARKEAEIISNQKRSSSRWQLTLGPLQTIIVSGALLGCVVGTFYLGFFSGRKSGFETARVASRAEVAKMPVPEDFIDEKEPDASSVYSELSGRSKAAKESPEFLAEEKNEQKELKPESKLLTPVPTNNPLGFSNDENQKKKTLGELLEQRVSEVRATVTPVPPEEIPSEKPTAEPPPTRTPSPTKTPRPTSTPQPKVTKEADLRQVIPAGWFAQVAAPKKIAEAQEIANKLKKSGFKVMIENADVRGETYYRIVVGPEQSKVQAERLVDQLSRESVVLGKPFVRKVQ